MTDAVMVVMVGVHEVMTRVDQVTLGEFTDSLAFEAGLPEDAIVGWNVRPLEDAMRSNPRTVGRIRDLVDEYMRGAPDAPAV